MPPEPIVSEVSNTDTSFVGARILKEGAEVSGGEPYTGIYEDIETQSYGFWQGDTLFFGAENASPNKSNENSEIGIIIFLIL